MSERVFYDASVTPLSEAEVRTLSSADCAAASEQLDALLVGILHDVDANFVRATRIITERILPALEAYGEASRDIHQATKFWQTFFEAAAGIRFTEEVANADETAAERAGDETNVSLDVTLRAEPEQDGTTKPVFSNELSDLDLLQAQIQQQFGAAPSPQPSVDLSEGDVLQPELETLSLGDLPGTRRPGAIDKGKGRAVPSPKKPSVLQSVLLKNTSTPLRVKKASVAVPAEAAEPTWTGLTDLSKTPLAAFSPAKRQQQPATRESLANDSFDIEPPVLHHFSLPRSRAALAKTPAKEAAQLVARDALEAAALRGAGDVESPLIEPPSVLRNWATRGYGDSPSTARKMAESPSARGRGITASDEEEDEGAEDEFNDSLVEEEAPWEEGFGNEEGASVSFAARHDLDDDGLEDTLEMDPDAEWPPAEDTLFGGRRATLQPQQQRKSADFLKRPQVEATFHGGQLHADPTPAARSPLQGRDARHVGL